MRRTVVLVTVLALALPGCTPEPELNVVVSLRRSATFPVLSTFARETGAKLNPRFISRDDPVGDDFDVLWSADPDVTIQQAEAGNLAKLSAAALATRPPHLVDPGGSWAAVTADVRVIAFDPQRIDEKRVPTRFEELLDPKVAPNIAIASTLSRSAAWHFAALFAANGSDPTAAFLRDLHRAGATILESEREVLDGVAGHGAPIGVVDGELAFTGREINRRLTVLIPDQDGAGAVLRATTVAVHKNAATSQRAIDLVEYLLSAPVGRRLALMSSHVALLPDGEPTAGALALRDLKIALPSQHEIARQLSLVRESLQDLR